MKTIPSMLFVGILLSIFSESSVCFAETLLEIKQNQSEVRFEAVGRPSLMKIKGQGAFLTGNLKVDDQNNLTGQLVLPLANFDTGISLRNQHMKEKYLEIAKFPEAKMVLNGLQLPQDWRKQANLKIPFKGQLTLRDLTKEVSGMAEINGNSLAATVKFEFKLTDFKVDIPSYMGITVADIVHVDANVVTVTEGKFQ